MGNNFTEDLLTDVSFVRWIRGEALPEEEKKWETWIQKDTNHRHVVEEAKIILVALQDEGQEIPDVAKEWRKVDDLLNRDEQKFFQLKNSKHNKSLYRKGRRLFAAAILILGSCLGLFAAHQFWVLGNTGNELTEFNPLQEYKTDFGEKATFRLSDNSRIVLNANSHIRFSSGSDGGLNTTEVWLQGEAWFDITHLEGENQRTFTVQTDNGSVEVLGTRFAVKTLKNETRAVLEEGTIQIQVTRQPGEVLAPAGSTILKPGDMALFSSDTEKITVEKVNPRIYTSWNQDIWFFENTAVQEVVHRIENTFGLEVKVREDLVERKLSGSIKSTNINVLSEALSKILGITIKQSGQTLHIGTEDENGISPPN